MNEIKNKPDEGRIRRTMQALEKNNMQAFYCENSESARELVQTLIKEGDTISSGGSATLKETGIIDIIKSEKYNYLDRSRPNITPQEIDEVYRKVYSADAYFSSANAVTEDGFLYNVDGNSNRVSAILYGPRNVVIVCGYNKIVNNLDDAVRRVKECAAPKNTVRLEKDTYCRYNGECVSLGREDAPMCGGCSSPDRICCNYVVSAYQRVKNRIKVIIIGEELGY